MNTIKSSYFAPVCLLAMNVMIQAGKTTLSDDIIAAVQENPKTAIALMSLVVGGGLTYYAGKKK